MIEGLSIIYPNVKITHNDCKKYLKTVIPKDSTSKLNDCTRYILNDYKSIDKCLAIYEQNKVLLPLMIYQNYVKNLDNRQCTTEEYYKSCMVISNSISIGDGVSTSIYTEQNWYLQKFYGFHTCCETTHELSKYKLKNMNYEILFTRDSDMSTKQYNKKNIEKINIRSDKKLVDILLLRKLIEVLITKNKLLRLKNIFAPFDLDIATFIKLLTDILKVDKTIANPMVLNTKTIKYLKQI